MLRRWSPFLRFALLLFAALLPFLTLVHKSDAGRWEGNHGLMVAPDEFSYLLTADSLLHGKGISTLHTLGRDTFYPPGYPLLLAAWFQGTTVAPFHAHVLNAILLSAATIVAYFFSRRLLLLLSENQLPRFRWGGEQASWFALLIAALFAANWNVLETALFVLSEPAFMLVTFAWLALALKWKHWHRHPLQTLAVTLLAIAAWSIRGAGLVCIGVTLLYPLLTLFKSNIENRTSKIACILLILALAAGYQLTLFLASPEKSLFSHDASANSYPRQLLNGITHGGQLHPDEINDWPRLAGRIGDLAVSHLDDFACSFTPWLRDPPDFLPRYIVGKCLALFAIAGFLRHVFRRRHATPLLDLYLVCYFILYLLWPFNMPRFWSPILPIMLVFAVDAVRHFAPVRRTFSSPRLAAALLSLLLLLSLEELYLKLESYQRRINYVSSALALSAQAIARKSSDPAHTIIIVGGDDEHFVFSWYLPHVPGHPQLLPTSPAPHLPAPDGPRESLDHLLLDALTRLHADPSAHVLLIRYFSEPDFPQLLRKLHENHPEQTGNVHLEQIFRRGDATTVWEIQRRD